MEMPRLIGVRDSVDWTFYDTLVAADSPCEVARKTPLFGRTNLGQLYLTNMMAAGQFPGDCAFSVMSVPTYVSFGDDALYGVMARDAHITVVVGGMRYGDNTPLMQTMVRGERPNQRFASDKGFVEQYDRMAELLTNKNHRTVLSMLYAMLPGALMIPISIPPRQHFSIEFDLYNDAHAILGNANCVKSVVQCARGILSRDL